MFEVGDEIAWWDDTHGRGIDPDDPAARRYTGVVTAVHPDPADPGRAVAYSVVCSGLLGEYMSTVRLDLGHRPELAAEKPAQEPYTPG